MAGHSLDNVSGEIDRKMSCDDDDDDVINVLYLMMMM